MGKDAKEDQKSSDMLNKDKPKHHNKLMQDIEKARHAADDPIVGEKQTANKKGALEPLKNDPKAKLDHLPAKQDKKKLDPFEDIDLLDFDDSKSKPKMEVKKEDKKEEKKDSKKKDVDDFDFEFEDIHPDEGSKIPPDGNKINKETNPANNKNSNQSAPKGLEKRS